MLSWKIVLYNHAGVLFNGVIEDMQNQAAELGYHFFCWNGRIYDTATGADSGMTVDDVK